MIGCGASPFDLWLSSSADSMMWSADDAKTPLSVAQSLYSFSGRRYSLVQGLWGVHLGNGHEGLLKERF